MNANMSIAEIINTIRNILQSRGYKETVSPILRSCDSAINKRFYVHNSRNDTHTYLRDCMETDLRIQVSSTNPRIFEIGPCFRTDNEDKTHKQEFYMMELYSYLSDLNEMRDITQTIVEKVLCKNVRVQNISLKDEIRNEFGVDNLSTEALLDKITGKYNFSREQRPFEIVNSYIEKKEEVLLTNPDVLYFLEDYPECTIDSADNIDGSFFIKRFEAYYKCREIAHAFVDCMDAEVIRKRVQLCSTLDKEKEILISLTKDGKILPTTGLGIGINRLFMIGGNND